MLYGWKFDFWHFELDKVSKLICCYTKLLHNSLLLNNIGIGRTPLFTNSIVIEIAFYLHTLSYGRGQSLQSEPAVLPKFLYYPKAGSYVKVLRSNKLILKLRLARNVKNQTSSHKASSNFTFNKWCMENFKWSQNKLSKINIF